jgi:hypothetical protein
MSKRFKVVGLLMSVFTGLSLMFCKTSTQTSIKPNPIFSYDALSYDTLNYELFTPDRFNLISENKIQLNRDYVLRESKYLVEQGLKIKYTKYNASNIDTLTQYRDKIEILDKSYILDSLFYGEDFSVNSEPRTSALNAVYKFSFANRKYLCFYIQDITNPDAMINTDILLFDITNLNQINIVLHDSQASEDLKCFGDFNKNNKLDFASWSYGNSFKDTLQLYELESNRNQFIIDKSSFLVITDTAGTYYVDFKKSNWFSNSPISKF